MSDLASRVTEAKAEEPKAEEPKTTAPDAMTPKVADADAVDPSQTDGAVGDHGGSGLHEPEFDVEVSLADLQNNEATPFYSATNWQDLSL